MNNILILLLSFIILSCNPAPKIKSVNSPPRCLASQSQCVINNELGQFSVLFNVDKIHGDLPFELSIAYKSVSNDIKFSGFLEGKDMFMGKIPVFFNKLDDESRQSADVLLVNCSEEQMVWRLWITIEIPANHDKELIKKSFFIDFTSSRL